MDAVEYLKTLCRMCHCECLKCEFGKARRGFETCSVWQRTHPKEAVEIAEKWAKEHPLKTRQSEFLKMFPNVILNDKGQPSLCAKLLDTTYHRVGGCGLDVDTCQRCMDNFWGQEME